MGWNRAAVSNCYLTGSVTGGINVGGLCGRSDKTIGGCYATGNVSGGDNSRQLGGLCGANGGDITDCYATGMVSSGIGVLYIGGLCGRNNSGTISTCYSTGMVSSGIGVLYIGGLCGRNWWSITITDCFWDIETSDCNTSAGGTPKTTAEMKTESTFISAGWDFVGERRNGLEDIWAICEATNYPRLVWQIPAADWICPDGVGLEDFSYLGGAWGTADPNPANLDGEDGIGFGDLMIFCEFWLSGR